MSYDSMNISQEAVGTCAAALSVMRADPLLIEAWIGALSSGAYPFGHGLLRSDEDQMDAFGVLIEMNDTSGWSWDPEEGAWSYAGDCYEVAPQTVLNWLIADERVRADSYLRDSVIRLINEVQKVNDGASSFAPVVRLLRDANEKAKQDAQRRQDDMRALSRPSEYDYIGRPNRMRW